MTLLCYSQVIDVMLPTCYLQYIQPIYRIYIYIYIYIHDIMILMILKALQ